MGDTVLISLAHGAIFALIAGFLQLVRQKRSGPDVEGAVGALIIAFALVFGIDFLWILLGTPAMSHRLEFGGWGLTFVDLILVLVACLIVDVFNSDLDDYGRSQADGNWAPSVIAGVLVVVSIFGYLIDGYAVNPPDRIGCDSDGKTAMVADILPGGIKDLTQPKKGTTAAPVPDTNPDQLIRVTPELARAKANQNLSLLNGNSQVSVTTYAQINGVYLQKYLGHWVYVVDLQVVNTQGFNQYGARLPGFLIISAEDPDAQPQAVTGYSLKVVPGLGVGQPYDLKRYAYFNWNLDHPQYQILDLDGGLEIDDSSAANPHPYYLGTLVENVVGAAGKKVVGMLRVDPVDGSFTQWNLDQIPAWVDRVYPDDYLYDYLSNYWAPWVHQDPCNFNSTAGKLQIDSDTYQITGDPGSATGAAFVYTFTSVNSDTSMLGEVVVDPRTGAAKAYRVYGATQPEVVDHVNRALQSQKIGGVSPAHCQIHRILGQNVWYCILVSGGKANYGVALLQAKYTTDTGKVIIETNLSSALDDLSTQIAVGDITDNPALSKTIRKGVQFQGIVTVATNAYNDNTGVVGGSVIGLMLDGVELDNGQKIALGTTFIAPASTKELPYVRPGDHVIVTATVTPGVSVCQMSAVIDTDRFPLPSPSPSPTPSPSVAPTATPK